MTFLAQSILINQQCLRSFVGGKEHSQEMSVANAERACLLTMLPTTDALRLRGSILNLSRALEGGGWKKGTGAGVVPLRWKCETKEVSRSLYPRYAFGSLHMIYVIMFSRKLGNPLKAKGQAQFYVGYCDDDRFGDRIAEHLSGRGAAITRAAKERGIGMQVILTMPGDRSKEREIKNLHNTPKFVRRELAKRGRDVFLSEM